MKLRSKKVKFTKKETKRLIRCVRALKLEIPPNALDEEWGNIDTFLKKPAGSSFFKFQQLLEKYWKESSKLFSSWIFLDLMKTLIPSSIEGSNNADHFSQISDFNMTSISQQRPPNNPFPHFNQDPDVNFLLQLVPDIKAFDGKSKSIFKLETMKLIHNLKYNNSDSM